jgi:hypothetical protein
VPTEQLGKAAELIRLHPEIYAPSPPSPMIRIGGMAHLYPRFKCVGIALFFTLTTSQECHIPCSTQNVERSDTSLPYPKLHIYAQSLLDGKNLVDLEDLVDGMNLSMEWGEQNLQLDGNTDVEWARWRIETLGKSGASRLRNPHSSLNPESRRNTWETTVRDENKKKRQSLKVRDKLAHAILERRAERSTVTQRKVLLIACDRGA